MNVIVRIAVIGDFNPESHSHRAINAALDHAAAHLGLQIKHSWISTTEIQSNANEILTSFDGIWTTPGSPYKSKEGVLHAIEFARTRDWPFVGT